MKIKSLIMTALFMLNISTMAHSKEIDLALYYKPGGGSDRHSSIIAKSLETQGVTVNKKFFKTCVEALNHVKNNNNALLNNFRLIYIQDIFLYIYAIYIYDSRWN